MIQYSPARDELRAKILAHNERLNEEVRKKMAESKPKASSLVIEALVVTYVGVFLLLILLSLILGWGNIWTLVLLGVGGAIILGVFGYAGSVWASAWRASRRTRS